MSVLELQQLYQCSQEVLPITTLTCTYLIRSFEVINNRGALSEFKRPFLPWYFIFIAVNLNTWAVYIPQRFGKKFSELSQPVQFLTKTSGIGDFHGLQLLRKIKHSDVEFCCSENFAGEVCPIVYLDEENGGVSQTNFPKVIFVNVLDTVERVCGVVSTFKNHLVNHLFGRAVGFVVIRFAEQLEVTLNRGKQIISNIYNIPET